ncbi:helix-turn-helix domain-containing protein [Paenibacillus dokdonensis]|uniref:helix-turn-helix domain-containing protein n=1 Tax=Paenibacillus dokdonensis TaxID=2567944 RepID=UPI001457DD42|nr:helix-turn-helix transcriptional regulator [Paenibacillus dokdonensis]
MKQKTLNITTAQTKHSTPGGRIRNARLAANLTIREVASQIGLTPEAISMIENEHNQPSLLSLRKLSDCLDKSLWYFGGFENLPEATLGDRIRKARFYNGLHVDEVASIIGVDPRSIRNWEQNKRTPSAKFINDVEIFLTIIE